jgi:hypothetical protein
MSERHCIQCAKPLPATYGGDKCSLCSIGLLPASGSALLERESQTVHVVEGRKLSGVPCPQCHAELTMADLGFCSCAICGTHFSRERAEALLIASRHKLHYVTPFVDSTLGDRAWPDDAPLR